MSLHAAPHRATGAQRDIVDPNITYAGLEAESILSTYEILGLTDQLPKDHKQQLDKFVAAYQETVSS